MDAKNARRLWTALAVVALVVIAVTAALVGRSLPGATIAGTALPAAPGLVPATAPVPTTPGTTTVIEPDPLTLLRPGDCVALPPDETDPPEPVECTSLAANYRVLQTGPEPCTGPLYKVEASSRDRAGNYNYHLCLAYDWRAGMCYETTDMNDPVKVDCATPGPHVVQVTAVFENSLDGTRCPTDQNGAVAITWDKRMLTVCFRGGDDPGR
ncbi:hypothetical protein IU501_16745 [Nocardia otitidiscaviarum]|uniref:LppU/SCO3897 family protein n=1 Tax=Nocardia otitidiscaviarum TaxID=1823 RepID=UPI0004A770D2|nr:hypothetical protein [Nocardia otitidiscaviarum]MBF6134645.1 hypothetical protein [Nocardia otitidiscaviarum]MBF6485729.1 hypothetical protein [Nocardia otitidiscaviarum]